MTIRRYRREDAEPISALLRRNFLEVNIRDYPPESMQALAAAYDASHVAQVAGYAHTYVMEEAGELVATGSISSFWGSETESILLMIFVQPEKHGQGLGRQIIATLEADELFLRASRIEIPASITARRFYEKMGYSCIGGVTTPDAEGHIRMEKRRKPA